jgi:hypothetical protein
MAIDVYSPCPGATGKKIKFCCPDFVGELETIDRMIEGEQYTACLQHIKQLREKPANSDRQCLLALQAQMLRATRQMDAAAAHATAFVEKYPANQAALAEACMMALAKDDFASAMDYCQRAIVAADKTWCWQTFQATNLLAEAYFSCGKWLPARALLQFLLMINRENPNVSRTLSDLFHSIEIPLLLKEDVRFAAPPETAPWKTRYAEALAPIGRGDWRTAESLLAALWRETASPDVCRSLATLRGWLGDMAGCIEALHQYAALDVSEENAVEAEATAMLLTDDPLGDALPVLSAVWTVKEVEPLQESLLSDHRLMSMSFNPAELAGEDSPPPKAIFAFFDRLQPELDAEPTLESMPKYWGQLLLFGRQTDREARLEMQGVTSTELDQIKGILGEIAGRWIEPEVKIEEAARTSLSKDMLEPQWQTSREMPRRQIKSLVEEYRRDALLHRWSEIKLGALDGLSPREAAGKPALRVKLSAALLVLQHYLDAIRSTFDLKELRTGLGLPALEPIAPEPGKIYLVPLVRIDRFDLEKLADADLVQAFQRAVAYNHLRAVFKFGAAIIERPAFEGKRERLLAYMTLARLEDDLDRAMEYIESGRRAVNAANQSNAAWDIEELSLRFARGEINEALTAVRHIELTHINEPNIAQMLTQILVQVGLLRPDGTPAVPHRHHPEEMAAAAETAAEPGKLWTPDGDSPAAGKGKLWVPD